MALDGYFPPELQSTVQPDWLKLMTQGQAVPPDQAQMAAAQSGVPQALQAAPDGPQYQSQTQSPLIPTSAFPKGQGLPSYIMSPESRAVNEQYKAQAQKAMLEQQAGIGQLQQQRDDFAKRSLPIDYSPIAALVDSMNSVNGQKTNMYEAALANRGMTQDQKDDKLLKLQEYIQGAKGNMSKESLEALKGQLQMLHENDLARHYASTENSAADRSKAFMDRNDIARDNQSKQAGDIFDKDSLMKQYSKQGAQIGVDRHTLETATIVPQQMMDEMAGGLATAISGGRAAGLGQTEMQRLTSLEGDIAKARSYSGKPMNSLTPDQRKFLLTTFDRLGEAYQYANLGRYNQLRQGRNYSHNPGANAALDAKRPVIAGTSPAIGTIEDGHKFLGGDPADPKSWEQQ